MRLPAYALAALLAASLHATSAHAQSSTRGSDSSSMLSVIVTSGIVLLPSLMVVHAIDSSTQGSHARVRVADRQTGRQMDVDIPKTTLEQAGVKPGDTLHSRNDANGQYVAHNGRDIAYVPARNAAPMLRQAPAPR